LHPYRENQIKIDIGSNWWVFGRHDEPTREILLIPGPPKPWDREAESHNNTSMVCSTDFWEKILSLEKKLKGIETMSPFEGVVINFGQWETAMRMNPSLTSCHPHAHVWLTPEFMSKVDTSPDWNAIHGHLAKPEDYFLVNAQELETLRLADLRHKDVAEVKQDVAKLKQDVTILKEGMSEVLRLLRTLSKEESTVE